MLTESQMSDIREHLDKAQNPIFFYDNDADGLCSYVLFRKFIDRGKGVVIRSHPNIDVGYTRKIYELNADYIFVLDRPILGKAFVDEISKLQLPIVWIDHHDADNEDYGYDNLFRYNPGIGKKKSSEPVTYWAYKITKREEDSWIAVMGCIADHYMPDFSEDFAKRYREYWGKVEKPFEAYYETGIGLLARAIGFGLKDSVTHVIYLQNYLINCKSPAEAFLEIESNSSFGRKFRELKSRYDNLMSRAKECVSDKVIFFSYGGDLSISSEISNELSYRYPDNFIIVAYTSGAVGNLSIRGKGVRKIIEKILPGFEYSSGGGHEDAVGARIQAKDLERFKREFEEQIK